MDLASPSNSKVEGFPISPPKPIVTPAIDGSSSLDGELCLSIGIQERIFGIILLVGGRTEGRSSLQVETRVAL